MVVREWVSVQIPTKERPGWGPADAVDIGGARNMPHL